MRHVYVNLPHYEGITKELNEHFKLCDKNEAHAIVTEFPDEYSPSCFVIIIKDKNRQDTRISKGWQNIK